MQGADARRIEGIGHHPPHRAHIDAAVGAAGTVPGGEPQPGRKAVVLGGVGVHNEHLRRGAVLFDGKGQGLRHLAAMSAAVCRVLFLMLPAPQGMYFSPLPCPNCCSVTAPASAGRASSGCKATKYCSTPVCTGAGSFLLRRHRRGLRHAFRRRFCCPALHGLLPQMQQGLRGGHRRCQKGRQHQRGAAGKDAQRCKQHRSLQKGHCPALPRRQTPRLSAAHGKTSFLHPVSQQSCCTVL